MASAVASTSTAAFAGNPPNYVFPSDKLLRVPLASAHKTPVVLVACGSFSPITFLHLRMFEMARDHLHFHTDYVVVGGYISPVNDAYSKKGLAASYHRVRMCALAVESSSWLSVDPFEAQSDSYVRTAAVLDHFDRELNGTLGGVEVEVEDEWGEIKVERRKCKVMLLAGSDLIQTMSVPGVWSEEDLHHILGLYGCVIITRDSDSTSASSSFSFASSSIHSRSPLALYRSHIHIVEQLVRNDVSSTKIRLFLKKGMSVLYLIPGEVARYIESWGLYRAGDSRKGSMRDITRAGDDASSSAR